jgi:prepilin-type N-terminal cleavage/methylation domain-containing protein
MVGGRSQQRGFTVIEVLMGIALFGVIMPSVILAVVGVSRLNDRAADLTRANIIAEEKFDTLRSAGYNSITDGTITFTSELPATFTAPRSATYTVATPNTGVKSVQINISYTDQGTSRNLAFKTIISELGVAQ